VEGEIVKSRFGVALSVLVVVSILAACGGGGDDESAAPSTTAPTAEEVTTEEEEETTTEEEDVDVPSVVDQTQEEAEETLEDAGFEVEVTTTPGLAEAGTVLEQDPEPGDEAEEGSTVELAVSEGPEPLLLALVPGTSRPTCKPVEASQFPESAIAKVECAPPNRGAHVLRYNLFATQAEMTQAYKASLAGVEDDLGNRIPGGDCSEDRFAVDTWEFQGSKGGVLCYVLEGRAWIEWTDREVLVYAWAIRNDDNDLALYRWWNDRRFSGPLPAPQP
jgi:PASTA domain